jgi:hypothetical protein
VKTIDLIPGPKRKFIVGNVNDLPKDGVGKIKFNSFIIDEKLSANNMG